MPRGGRGVRRRQERVVPGAPRALPPNARVRGQAQFRGTQLLTADPRALERLRGAAIGMVFQDPMTALTPHLRVGEQIAEVLVRHRGLSWAARARARSSC